MIYDSKGNINCAVVTGVTYVGAYSPEGYRNIILSDGLPKGVYHPCGALRVTVNNEDIYRGIYAPDGSLYVTTVDYNNGALKVFEASGSLGSAVGSGAETLATGETQALALDFTDDFFLATTGQYGSAWILDTGTPANDYDSSPDKVSASLLTYTSPSVKLVRGSDGLFRFNAHNLYLNSTTPANQSITVLSGAPYAVTITGAATMTASGAATGVMSAGTTTFTAATGTLTFGSTSGAGTVHVRRTPSDDTYMQTAASARYTLPFEWSSAGVLEGVLREPSDANLLLRSTAVQTSPWAVLRAAVTADAVASPIDGLTASEYKEDSGTGQHLLFQPITATAGAVHTAAAFVKIASGARQVRIKFNSNGEANGAYATFDVAAGTQIDSVATGTGTLVTSGIEALGSGWYRIWITGTAAPAATACNFVLALVHASTGVSYTGDGASGIYVAHAQLIQRAYVSSPIITYGASVTRAADTITLPVASFPALSTAYSLLVEFKTRQDIAVFPFQLQLSGTDSAGLFLNATFIAKLFAADGGVTQADLLNGANTAALAGNVNKMAGAWEANDFRVSHNGGAVGSDVSGTLPTEFTSLTLASATPSYVRKAIYVPRAWTNAELLSLSTL